MQPLMASRLLLLSNISQGDRSTRSPFEWKTTMRLSVVALALPLIIGFTASAEAHHKQGHHIPPGQLKKMISPQEMERIYVPDVVIPAEVDFVCLVTTDVAGDPYAPVAYTEWLPRVEAEAEAGRGRSFVIYHPDFNTELGCTGF